MKDIIKDRIEKIENNIVPQGYKKTEIGIIPEDWKVEKLGEVSDVISGGTPSTTNKEYWNGDIMWATPTDITKTNKYITKTERRITKTGLINSSANLLPENSILMTSRATIGEKAINLIPMSTNQGFKSFITKKNKLNSMYLYYKLDILKYKFLKKAAGSTFLEISKKDVENTNLPIPPLKEQEKIASILSTWDQYIENIDSIIESKKKQKKGLMQNLLTGEVRLPGFNGEWKEVKLGDICEITTGKLDANAMVKNGKYKFFTCAKEVYRINEYSYDTEALLISGNGANVGYIHYYNGKFNAYQRTYILNKFTEYIIFIKYNLDKNLSERIYLEKRSGNTPYITMGTLTEFKLNLPPLDEQVAIASVLSSADREIELLEDLRNKRMEEKKGLMQLLLTGIVRVGG